MDREKDLITTLLICGIVLLIQPLFMAAGSAGLSYIPSEEVTTNTDFSLIGISGESELMGTIARSKLGDLAGIGSRIPGSAKEADAASYISSSLSLSGYEVTEQPFSFRNTDGEDDLKSRNIIALKPGKLSEEVMVCAHYDSTDDADGADDNAAGIAVLLETANWLYGVDTLYTIRFVAFGAEEADLDGSRYYVSQMNQDLRQKTVGMINLDSLIAGDRIYLYADAGTLVYDMILDASAKTGLDLETKAAVELDGEDGTPCECADYVPFQDVGIPFAYLEASNWDMGEKDGLTQVDPEKGEDGLIRHTRFDTISAIDDLFPGRADSRLEGFVRLLVTALI